MKKKFKEDTIVFDAHLVPSGSRAEGTSSSDSDYDFLVVLLKFKKFSADNFPLKVELKVPARLTSSSIGEKAPRYISYYSLSTNNQIETSKCDAEDFLSEFRKQLKTVVTEICPEAKIGGKGPAVSLYLKEKENDRIIKVDLSLAIEVTSHSVPQIPAADDSIDDAIKEAAIAAYQQIFNGVRQDGGKYYFIASGEWWKLSACAQEIKYMEDLGKKDDVAKKVYKVLKVRASLPV